MLESLEDYADPQRLDAVFQVFKKEYGAPNASSMGKLE